MQVIVVPETDTTVNPASVKGIGELVLAGRISRVALLRWRQRAVAAGTGARMALGCMLAGFGLLIVTGLDRSLETALVNASPQWLTALTTRF